MIGTDSKFTYKRTDCFKEKCGSKTFLGSARNPKQSDIRLILFKSLVIKHTYS